MTVALFSVENISAARSVSVSLAAQLIEEIQPAIGIANGLAPHDV